MKTLTFILMIAFCLSCTKEPNEITDPPEENVKIKIDYTFQSSGSITTKGESSYQTFYNKYIASKKLTPRTYQLVFEGFDSTTFMSTALGKWGSNNLISIPTGRYRVKGESSPTANHIAGDTCYFKFDEIVTIEKTTTTITLNALYTCSLILIDTANVLKAELFSGSQNNNTFKKDFMKTDEYYHTFARDSYLMDRSKYAVNFTLMITKRDGNIVNMLLWNYFWEAGRYYYFSNKSTGYALLPMVISPMVDYN